MGTFSKKKYGASDAKSLSMKVFLEKRRQLIMECDGQIDLVCHSIMEEAGRGKREIEATGVQEGTQFWLEENGYNVYTVGDTTTITW